MKKWIFAAGCATLCVPSIVPAQEMKAERLTGTNWVLVEMIKFLPGKRERAGEIVEQYFTKASNDIGGGVVDLHLDTGEWDFITVFPMEGGPADMTWQTSPVDIRFMNALAKYAGGMDSAKKMMAEWNALVAKQERHIAHRHANLK